VSWRGSLGAALLLASAGCGAESAPTTTAELVHPGAHLLLISVDTLRADRLGCYGYDRPTTPVLDALAAEAVLFEEMYANSCKTASSHMSLFTSVLPTVHKVRNQSARLGLESPVLAGNRLGLPQVLNQAGYRNAAVCGGGNLVAGMGFNKGFKNRFESNMADVSWHVGRTLQRFDQVLQQEESTPGFVFMHTYQVHGPYLPPAPYREIFAPNPQGVVAERVRVFQDMPFQKQWQAMNHGAAGQPPFWDGKENFGQAEAAYFSDLYDGEVAYTDAMLGELFEGLRERGLYDDMMIVVLSDHGEEFFEHGSFEHDQLFRESLHVPCLVKLPGGQLGGTRVSGLTSLIDVAPTIYELLDLSSPPTAQGQSLTGAMLSGQTFNQPIIAERVMFLPDGDYQANLRSDSLSLHFDSDLVAQQGILTAYDLTSDPDEHTDTFGDSAPATVRAAESLRTSLIRALHDRDILDAIDSGGTLRMNDPAQLEELKALGYTGNDGGPIEPPKGTPLDVWPERSGG
jgi:arylsulfatase A-like enzyme